MAIVDELKNHWRHGGAVKRLLFVNIGVFLALHLMGLATKWLLGSPGLELPVIERLMTTNDLGLLLRRPWTVITYMFTHYEVMHLLWNMVMLWFGAQIFQMVLGEGRLLGQYVLGGLAGWALYVLASFTPAHLGLGGSSMMLGASASVMAIIVGAASYRPDLEVQMLLLGRVRLKYVALVMVIIDLINIRDGSNTGGHLAHLGGALYGYLAGHRLAQGGRDWSLLFTQWLNRIWERVRKPFKKKGIRVEYRRTVPRDDYAYNAEKKTQQERVDAILDKISRSGYDSLSKADRDFLFRVNNDKR